MRLIHEQGNDYVIAAKANQGKLYRHMVKQAHTQPPTTQVVETVRGHGRSLQRTVSTFELGEAMKRAWRGAQQVVHVHQQGQRGAHPYTVDLYYLTSLNRDAAALSARIRNHWGIENKLHWVKDVVMQEDHASIKQPAPASLMAILRNLAVSLFRAHGYPSIVAAIDLLSNDFDQLLPILGFSGP